MTTPTGPISMSNVRTEFGGSPEDRLTEYYRGGSLVPTGTAAGTSGVQISPSGAIRLGDFRGVTKPVAANYSMLAGYYQTYSMWGYSRDTGEGASMGSLSPNVLGGFTITAMYYTNFIQFWQFYFTVAKGYNSFVPQNLFGSITLNGATFNSANAGFTSNNGENFALWEWDFIGNNLTAGVTYPVNIVGGTSGGPGTV